MTVRRFALRVDDLDGEDAVRGHAVLASEPAQAAAQAEAGDRRVGVAAGQTGEAVLAVTASTSPHLTPAPTRAMRCSGSTWICCSARVRSRIVPLRGERRAVADGLGRDGHAVLDRVADGGDDVLRVLDVDDGERALVDGDGEPVTVGVVVGIGREGDLAGQRLDEARRRRR